MIKLSLTFLCFVLVICVCAQNRNPIIFAEIGSGYVQDFTKNGGINQYAELNFEKNKNLFSFRYSEIDELKLSLVLISPFTPIPIISSAVHFKELGLLYGRRMTKNNFSYSGSAGISSVTYIEDLRNENNQWFQHRNRFVGVPFEFNVKWFKREKSPYRIYEIIPVGKETGFGNSIGFKLSGNISKHSYAGLGLVFGIGYHKEY